MNKLRIAYLSTNTDYKFEPVFENPYFTEKEFEIDTYTSSDDLLKGLAKKEYTVIVTGEKNLEVCRAKYFKLYKLPNYIKVKWLNIFNIEEKTKNEIAESILYFFSSLISAEPPVFFSIITPLYHTNHTDFIKSYESLKNQTCEHWEWILIDDSKDKKLTKFAEQYAKNDFRIRYYNIEHSGNIGNVKNLGFRLGRGTYLLELDHDDALMPTALEKCAVAFQNPEIGFVYSDNIELKIDDRNNILGSITYNHDENNNQIETNWGVSNTGYHYLYEYNGTMVYATKSPDINSQTIRTITAVPNHLRCWRSTVYHNIGGHNINIPVGDDYELMVKTFLNTRMCRITSVEYVQYYNISNSSNTQFARNAEIQRLTHFILHSYEKKIHDRIIELGGDDYCWNEQDQKGYFWEDFNHIENKGMLNYEL